VVNNFNRKNILTHGPTVVDFDEYGKDYLASTRDDECIQKPNQHWHKSESNIESFRGFVCNKLL
jgi:hypothetical protein